MSEDTTMFGLNKRPENLPADFYKPSKKYKTQAWLASLGLLVFISIYFGLTYWFCKTAYYSIKNAFQSDDNLALGLATGLPAAFIGLFMLKAIFFIKRGYHDSMSIEIKPEEEPKLFDFIYNIADEAHAPRPKKVFISPRVNACVFFNLTIFNFLFPNKKNLEIGLPLINTLNISEFKAVLAHEFGHFAQKTMAVGNWVYLSHQIASHLISTRGIMDRFLAGVARFDIRVAWVGWIMSLIVWSIRSILDTIFKIVIIAERSLSREMEFQADLVSVALTGSDALIHGLHKLQASDESWDETLSFAHDQRFTNKKIIQNLFLLQTEIINKTKQVLDDPEYGETPRLPFSKKEKFRIFNESIAQTPKMWATHPENFEREENAKKTYIHLIINEKSAWQVFKDPKKCQEEMSSHFYSEMAKLESTDTKDDENLTHINHDEALVELNKLYKYVHLDPKYKGAYLNRKSTAFASTSKDLFFDSIKEHNLNDLFSSLYPDTLKSELEKHKHLTIEKESYIAIQDNRLTAPGGVIKHRGKPIKKKQLKDVIHQIEIERQALNAKIIEHEKLCRTVHRAAATDINLDWRDYLVSLSSLLHYAEHTEAELIDAYKELANMVMFITADGNVSSGELKKLLQTATSFHGTLKNIYAQKDSVILNDRLCDNLEKKSWAEYLEKFELPKPNKENINEWMSVIDNWAKATIFSLNQLSKITLEELLITEDKIKESYLNKLNVDLAPKQVAVPNNYISFNESKKRKLQKKLKLWDRFVLADGIVASITRLAVAFTILSSTIFASYYFGKTEVIFFNGINNAVTLKTDNHNLKISPNSYKKIKIYPSELNKITTIIDNVEVEEFNIPTIESFGTYFYNVCSAAPLYKYYTVYGGQTTKPDEKIGTRKWFSNSADYIFQEPPESLYVKSKSVTKSTITNYQNLSPYNLISLVSKNETQKLIEVHARYDKSDSEEILEWIDLSSKLGNFKDVLNDRLKRQPLDVVNMRSEFDYANEQDKETIKEKHKKLLEENPDNPDLLYINIRENDDEVIQNKQYRAAYKRHPQNPWLANAAAFINAEQGDWANAIICWRTPSEKLNPLKKYFIPEYARAIRMQELKFQIKSFNNSNLIYYKKLREIIEVKKILETQTDSLKIRLNSITIPPVLKNYPNITKVLNEIKDLDPVTNAYALLYLGKLNTAHQGKNTESIKPYILRLIAVSDGATEELIEKALNLEPNEGINDSTIWHAITLCLKKDKDPKPYLDILQTMSSKQDIVKINHFISLIQNKASEKELINSLNGLRPKIRGHAYCMIYILNGKNTSAEIKNGVNYLLFETEKPYFK